MKLIRPYLVEIILIVSATIITGISIYLQLENKNTSFPEIQGAEDSHPSKKSELSNKNDKLHIDVSGAVLHPDLYEATPGSRLKDIIDLAGGLSDDADKMYIARNFNMSKFVTDQEKIYIPSVADISSGMFNESPKALEYLNSSDIATQNETTTPETSATTSLISLNDASIDELDSLPGIGPVTAQKIVDGRLYSSTEDLITKKVVNSSTFEKIKDLISL